MYGALYMRPNPTKGESGSSRASGVIRMAKAIKRFLVDVLSTR